MLNQSISNPTPSLLVMHGGVRYSLNLVFEPLYSPKGKMIAVEALSRFEPLTPGQDVVSPCTFYQNLTPRSAERIIKWQLECFKDLKTWLIENKVLVSLNLNRTLARACLGSASEISALSPWIRFEINEFFFTNRESPNEDPLLIALSESCPLWLDDFGIGGSNLQALMSKKFEAIKLDAEVFKRLDSSLSGHLFIDALRLTAAESGTKLIIEGIETSMHYSDLRQSGAWALQGWYWPSFSLHELQKGPWRERDTPKK